MCVMWRERERDDVQCMPTAGKPGVEKTGFVYTDAHSAPSLPVTRSSLYLLSNVTTREK